jgi:erythromycin esterase
MRCRKVAAALVLSFAGSVLAQSDPNAAFVAWARSRAVALDPAGKAFASLDEGISGARLIGVGESVHEVQTFLTLRLELLQDLVKRHRVTALVIETGMPEAIALDDYVRGKTASVDFNTTLPSGFGALTEIRRTMEWLREWNLAAGKEHPVAVYGADLPARSGSMVPALDHLERLTSGDPEVKRLIDSVRPTAAAVSSGWWKGQTDKYAALPAETKAALESDVKRLVEKVRSLSAGEKNRLEWSRRMAFIVEQNEAMLRLGAFSPEVPRDIALAENTLWVLGRLPEGERAVYWAHNAHVQKVPVKGTGQIPPGSFPGSGLRFEKALGKKYYAIGTAYGGPSLEREPTAAESGSVDAALEAVATKPFLITLRGAPSSAEAISWLSQERKMRFQVGYLLLPLGSAFDAVVYFDQVTKATRVK